jgi:hypothetical protein
MSRLRAALALGLLAAAVCGAGCSKPPPPPPPVPRPVQPPPPPPESPAFTVTTLNLGKAVYVDQNVTASTDSFGRKDTVFLSVVSDGLAPSVVLRTRWYGPKGLLLQEGSQTISSLGPKATAFHLDNRSGLALGKYSVELFVNDAPKGSKQFEVFKKPPGGK